MECEFWDLHDRVVQPTFCLHEFMALNPGCKNLAQKCICLEIAGDHRLSNRVHVLGKKLAALLRETECMWGNPKCNDGLSSSL